MNTYYHKRKATPTKWARSIHPKFPEIRVQNSMDRFGPTGKASKKTGPPFEVDHFSRSDLACVASVSARVRQESRDESKKKKGMTGEGKDSIVNACYAG